MNRRSFIKAISAIPFAGPLIAGAFCEELPQRFQTRIVDAEEIDMRIFFNSQMFNSKPWMGAPADTVQLQGYHAERTSDFKWNITYEFSRERSPFFRCCNSAGEEMAPIRMYRSFDFGKFRFGEIIKA